MTNYKTFNIQKYSFEYLSDETIFYSGFISLIIIIINHV